MKKPRWRILRLTLILASLLAAMSVTALASSSEGVHDAYYYILMPEYGTSPSHNTNHYEFMGQGSVSTALGSTDKEQTIAVTSKNSGYITAPTPNENPSFIDGTAGDVTGRLTYPAVTFDGSPYYYKGSEAAVGSGRSYDIVWYRYSCSEGFNIGTNSFYGGNKWHVDGYLTLSDKASVTYKVQFPGSDEFVLVNAAGTAGGVVFVDYVDNGKEFSEVDQPSVAMRGWANWVNVSLMMTAWVVARSSSRKSFAPGKGSMRAMVSWISLRPRPCWRRMSRRKSMSLP